MNRGEGRKRGVGGKREEGRERGKRGEREEGRERGKRGEREEGRGKREGEMKQLDGRCPFHLNVSIRRNFLT